MRQQGPGVPFFLTGRIEEGEINNVKGIAVSWAKWESTHSLKVWVEGSIFLYYIELKHNQSILYTIVLPSDERVQPLPSSWGSGMGFQPKKLCEWAQNSYLDYTSSFIMHWQGHKEPFFKPLNWLHLFIHLLCKCSWLSAWALGRYMHVEAKISSLMLLLEPMKRRGFIYLFVLLVSCLDYFLQTTQGGRHIQHTFLLRFSPQQQSCEVSWSERMWLVQEHPSGFHG